MVLTTSLSSKFKPFSEPQSSMVARSSLSLSNLSLSSAGYSSVLHTSTYTSNSSTTETPLKNDFESSKMPQDRQWKPQLQMRFNKSNLKPYVPISYPTQFPVIKNRCYGSHYCNATYYKTFDSAQSSPSLPLTHVEQSTAYKNSFVDTLEEASEHGKNFSQISNCRNGCNESPAPTDWQFSSSLANLTPCINYEPSPPPIRRFVFPFDTFKKTEVKNSFEKKTKNLTIISNKVSLASENYHLSGIDDEDTSFQKSNYQSNPYSHFQFSDVQPFSLYGIDCRTIQGNQHAENELEKCSSKISNSSHIFSSVRGSFPSVSLPSCYYQQPSSVLSLETQPEMTQWSHRNVNFSTLLAQEKMLVAPSPVRTHENKESEWITHSAVSSASVLG